VESGGCQVSAAGIEACEAVPAAAGSGVAARAVGAVARRVSTVTVAVRYWTSLKVGIRSSAGGWWGD
jgi:hypothetical protein